MNTFTNKYKSNYSKPIPLLTSGSGGFLAPNFLLLAETGSSPLERARKSLAKNQQTAPPPPKKPHRPIKQDKQDKQETPRSAADKPIARQTNLDNPPAKRTSSRRQTARPTIKSRRVKRPPIITATVTGLLLSVIVLLAITGLYGAYCFSQGAHGDASVTASTIMYALAVFVGCFWSSAMVKRQSYAPPVIIGVAYLIVSLVISAKLFALADFKLLMIAQKIVLTTIAGLAGYVLSLIPYLINKAIKHR